MDKDRVKGSVKDVAGRIQRQAGEWTGDEESQAQGAAKQAEGKIQKVWGQAKDAGRKAIRGARTRKPESQTRTESGRKRKTA